MKEYTVDEIRKLITTNRDWLERAILALHEFQTQDEKAIHLTHHDNGVGWNKPDSYKMTYYANWLQSGKHLTGEYLADAFQRIRKYAPQLWRINNGVAIKEGENASSLQG